jgi:PAS domain S-box-containing protein
VTDPSEAGLIKRFSMFASGAAISSMVIGLSVLAGWTLHIPILLTWGASTTMAPTAAVCSVLAGISLWLLRKQGAQSFTRTGEVVAKSAAAIVGLVGALTLIEQLFGLELGTDAVFVVKARALAIAGARIRMSPMAAIIFLLFGLALALIDWRTDRDDWPAQFLSFGAAMGAAFGLLGLVFGPKMSPLTLAFPAVVTYFVMALGIVCARAPWAVGGLLTANTQGATLLRRMVPTGLLVLGVVGWLISKPLLTAAHFTWIEVSALALLCSATLAGFIAWIAFIVDRGDNERRKLEQALRLSNQQMSQLLDRIEEPQAEATLRSKVRLGFALAIILTCLLSFLSWRMAQQTTEDADWVAHTHEVSSTLEATLRHLVDVESGERGFALTGNAPFLEPYDTGKSAAGQDLHMLRRLVSDNVEQMRRLDALEVQVNARIAAATDVVTSRQKAGKIHALAQFEHDKELMDGLRATIAEMEDAEKRLLGQRTVRARAAQHFNLSLIALGALMGVIFLSVAGATASREIGISARARARVIFLNGDLERRVQQRTAALQSEIANREDAEAALRESQGRLAGIVQSAMDSIITVDDEQRIVLFNNAAEKIFLCPAAEAIGEPITRFIPQRFHTSDVQHIRDFGETGVTNRIMGPKDVLWGLRADGQEFPIEASISQVVTCGEKLFTVILRDVTERSQAEAMRERLAAIVESSDDAIISKTLDGTIVAWNRGAEKVFGYSSAEAVGKQMRMILPTERVHEEVEILAQIARGESIKHFETVRRRKDGKLIDVSVTISPIRDGNGLIVGASKIARDITERKQVEVALRQQATVLDLGQVMMRDVEGTITLWTRGTEKLYGYTREEALGRVSHELLQTQFMEPLDRIERQLARTGAWEGELTHRKRDGSRITVASVWVLHRDAKGDPACVLESNADITGRKRAEEALRESEERFQAMANGIPQLAWMAEADGHIFWYNQRWYDYTGTTLKQMEGWGWQSVHDPEMLAKVLERWNGSIGRGEPFDMEFPLRGADGLFRMFLTLVMPVRDREGNVTRWFGTNTDISERKKSERQLAQLAQELVAQAAELATSRQALENQTLMLQSVLDSIDEGLVAADENGKFILWNPAATRIVGMGAQDVTPGEWNSHYGVYLPDTITPLPDEQNPLSRAIQGEVGTAEIFIRNAELEEGAWLEISGSPLKGRDGSARGGVVAFRDITQKKAAELEIRKLNESLEERIAQRTEQLETANRELESFTYSVSHDLRAPLRHIAGFAGACLEEFGTTVDPQALHYLQRIHDGTNRMGLLINELLNLARTGRRSLCWQLTELNSVVEEIIYMLKTETEGREMEWKVGNLPTVECDPVLVRQIFQNLLSNAIKYSRPRPLAVIEIGCTQEKDRPVIFVRDNGVGFNMQHAGKLFGVFQRLHREEEFEGTGVGLATVHRIVQKHGGRIWAEAELDRGATFYFTLGGSEIARPRSDAAAAGV